MEYYAGLIRYLERAKDLILAETVPDNQIALIILDNAVELAMRRLLGQEFAFSDAYENIYRSYEESLKHRQNTSSEEAMKRIKPMFFGDKEKNDLSKYFHKKVLFFKGKGVIDKDIASILLFLHDYRNKIYHEGERLEIIKSINFVYFEVVCRLLKSLPMQAIFHTMVGDHVTILNKYGVKDWHFSQEAFCQILDSLLVKLSLKPNDFRKHLTKNMIWRVEQTLEYLDFIQEHVEHFALLSKDKLLEFLVMVAPKKRGLFSGSVQRAFEQNAENYSLEFLEKTNDEIQQLVALKEDHLFLKNFLSLEVKYAPLEILVDEVASEVDQKIQMEVDIARGK